MSKDPRQAVEQPFDWKGFLAFLTKAETEGGIPKADAIVGCGIMIWMQLREVFDGLLGEPFVADEAEVDGWRIRPSVVLQPKQCRILPADMWSKKIPLVAGLRLVK